MSHDKRWGKWHYTILAAKRRFQIYLAYLVVIKCSSARPLRSVLPSLIISVAFLLIRIEPECSKIALNCPHAIFTIHHPSYLYIGLHHARDFGSQAPPIFLVLTVVLLIFLLVSSSKRQSDTVLGGFCVIQKTKRFHGAMTSSKSHRNRLNNV